MAGNGYARCDYRMCCGWYDLHAGDQPELRNLLCAGEPGSADFSLINDPVYNHHKFLKLIIRAAQNRRDNMLAAKLKKRMSKKQRVEQMAYT